MGERCKTRYPILLVHGVGARDDWKTCYWGRVPTLLRQEGATVYLGGQEAWAPIGHNSRILAGTVRRILLETGAEKINLIAHSKGGLECRCLISHLGLGDRVASLTTISTPHHGSKAMELLSILPKPLHQLVGLVADGAYLLGGDRHPDFYTVSTQLYSESCEAFNRMTPDHPGVYYQSYGSVLDRPLREPAFLLTHLLIELLEGENDGLVSTQSARWTNFQGILPGRGGVSHIDMVDRRRKERGFAVELFYLSLVEKLKNRGF